MLKIKRKESVPFCTILRKRGNCRNTCLAFCCGITKSLWCCLTKTSACYCSSGTSCPQRMWNHTAVDNLMYLGRCSGSIWDHRAICRVYVKNLHDIIALTIVMIPLRTRLHVKVFLKGDFFGFSLPSTSIRWKWSLKTHLSKHAWKRRLIVVLWMDENERFSNTMMSYIIFDWHYARSVKDMLSYFHPAFSCRQAKTIRIGYVWTCIFFCKAETEDNLRLNI